MATAAQINANQPNARRSTGPRTPEGKAASARNSTSRGLCSKEFVVLEGEEQEFSDFITALQAAIQTRGCRRTRPLHPTRPRLLGPPAMPPR